jgi:hypothetical protein
MSLDQLSASLQEVKSARFAVDTLKQEFEGNYNAFVLKNSALKAKLVAASTRVAEAEDRARGQALDIFEETQDKKPIKGVEIKIFTETKLDYNLNQAKLFCRRADICMIFDQAKFEKVAPILGLDFVKVTETSTPKAQLSRTL